MNAIYADQVRISGFRCPGGIGGPRTRTRSLFFFWQMLGSGPFPWLCCFWSMSFIASYWFYTYISILPRWIIEVIRRTKIKMQMQPWRQPKSTSVRAYLFAATFLRHVIYECFMSGHSGMRHRFDWFTWLPNFFHDWNFPRSYHFNSSVF